MPQWMVTMRNLTDPSVAVRRRNVRPAHIETVTALAAQGRILVGGALLGGAGEPAGSVAVGDVPDRDALDAWLRTDPYATGQVWGKVDVLPVAVTVRAP